MSPSFQHVLTEADPFFGDEYQIRPQEKQSSLKKGPNPNSSKSFWKKGHFLKCMVMMVAGLAFFNEAEAKHYSKCI